MFFKRNIKSRVMDRVNEVLDTAQKEHDDKLKALEEKHEQEKDALTDTAVSSILSKFVK